MKDLPRPARLYVVTVIALGVCLLLIFAPYTGLHPYRPGLKDHGVAIFFSLMALSAFCSAFKVRLPLAGGSSTMSLSYAVDFGAMVLLGPDQAMLISAAS